MVSTDVQSVANDVRGCVGAGCTDLHVVDAGVKINGQHYRDVLLTQNLLPDIRQYLGYYTFQQEGASAHNVCDTVGYSC